MRHISTIIITAISFLQSMMKIEQLPPVLLLPPQVSTKKIILMTIHFMQRTITFEH